MAGQHQGLVHIPAALVGPPDSRLLRFPAAAQKWGRDGQAWSTIGAYGQMGGRAG